MRYQTKYILIRLGTLTALAYLFSIWAHYAHADSYSSFMVGVFSSGKHSTSEVKFLNIGHREPLAFGLIHQYELGGWTDTVGGGRKGSAYIAYQIGLEAGDNVFMRVMVGPSMISLPDAYLGGPFELTEDFFIGLRGKSQHSIGFKYKHISSGGVYTPNVGRDLAGIEASLSF